jgi:hypothetical protein
MELDNGNGKEREGNNREYASIIFEDGARKDIVGGVTDPNGGDPEILIHEKKKVIRYRHSHPSGTHEADHMLHSFYPQAPRNGDIEACKGEMAVRLIPFGCGFNKTKKKYELLNGGNYLLLFQFDGEQLVFRNMEGHGI